MVWPTANIPTYGRGVWLECNGQYFEPDRFPQLYKSLGSDHVPNYQGMFLRGYGEQQYTQINGSLSYYDANGNLVNGYNIPSTTIHKSASIGEIQGDSMRHMYFPTDYSPMRVDNLYDFINVDAGQNWYHRSYPSGGGTANATYSENSQLYNIYYPLKPYHYRYELSGDSKSGYSLTERREDSPSEDFVLQNNTIFTATEHDSSIITPTSNEIRPVNVTVKFMIKAK